MDSPFFNDTPPPWQIVSPASVTLSTTDKALYTAAVMKAMGGQYWWPGKRVKIEAIGQMTSAATPGNFSISLYWGTGADANGTLLAVSGAVAWTASQTNMTWRVVVEVLCTSAGATGALLVTGLFLMNEAGIVAHMLIPATAPAAVTVDTTTSGNILSLQAKRSGSTAETMQIINGPILTVLN